MISDYYDYHQLYQMYMEIYETCKWTLDPSKFLHFIFCLCFFSPEIWWDSLKERNTVVSMIFSFTLRQLVQYLVAETMQTKSQLVGARFCSEVLITVKKLWADIGAICMGNDGFL